MNQKKIGEFITKLRKGKGLTQEELGEKLGISGKSVSKWERGIHLPDLNNLVPLAEILGVSVSDLLNGEVSYSNDNTTTNTIVVDNIKVYSNKYRRKFIFMFFAFVVMVILLISTIYFFNNYNRNRIYYISGGSANYYTNGYFIISPERNLLIIRKIDYNSSNVGTSNEPILSNINVLIYLDDFVLGAYTNDFNGGSLSNSITNILKNISFVIDDKTIGELSIDNGTKMKMVIEYFDKNGVFDSQEIILELNKIFSSDKLIYTK